MCGGVEDFPGSAFADCCYVYYYSGEEEEGGWAVWGTEGESEFEGSAGEFFVDILVRF